MHAKDVFKKWGKIPNACFVRDQIKIQTTHAGTSPGAIFQQFELYLLYLTFVFILALHWTTNQSLLHKLMYVVSLRFILVPSPLLGNLSYACLPKQRQFAIWA